MNTEPTAEAREAIHSMLFSVVFASPEERETAYTRIATSLAAKDAEIQRLKDVSTLELNAHIKTLDHVRELRAERDNLKAEGEKSMKLMDA